MGFTADFSRISLFKYIFFQQTKLVKMNIYFWKVKVGIFLLDVLLTLLDDHCFIPLITVLDPSIFLQRKAISAVIWWKDAFL